MGLSNIFVQCNVPSPEKALIGSSPSSRILPASQGLPLHGLEPLSLVCDFIAVS
jgi:hypothetical protein